MKGSFFIAKWGRIAALALSSPVFCGAAWAEEGVAELPSPASAYIKDYESFKLAANETGQSQESVVRQETPKPVVSAQPEFKEPVFTASKMHQYLGIATVAAAAATFLTHFHPCEGPNCGQQPPRNTNGTHATLGKATAVLAAATVASGLYAHWDDFHKEDGLSDPDNLHVLLGAAGAAAMIYAINKSANSSVTPTKHAPLAELGALSMIVAIKLTW